jgi:hypothetical protein
VQHKTQKSYKSWLQEPQDVQVLRSLVTNGTTSLFRQAFTAKMAVTMSSYLHRAQELLYHSSFQTSSAQRVYTQQVEAKNHQGRGLTVTITQRCASAHSKLSYIDFTTVYMESLRASGPLTELFRDRRKLQRPTQLSIMYTRRETSSSVS